MRGFLIGALAAVSFAGLAYAAEADLALAFVGRDAVFVDMNDLHKKDGVVNFRILKVVQNGQTIMEHPYIAAWQEASIDCNNREYRALSQNRLEADGHLLAKEYLRGDAYPIGLGTAEAGLEAAVCKGQSPYGVRVATVADAVTLGRSKAAETQSAAAN